jgi:hypothetical protein
MALTKATQNVLEGIVSTGSTGISAGLFIVAQQYKITALGTTTQAQWNTIAGTTGQTYVVGSLFTAATDGASSGTGAAAVARTLANRFADVVNVLDFGAFNDGTNATATTAAIQNAVNYAPSNLTTVIIPYGTYSINSEISIPSNRVIIIQGVLIRSGSGTLNGLRLNGNNITIKGDGELRGPQYGQTISYVANQNAIANNVDTTLAIQLKNIKIEGLVISGWGDAGVEVWDIDNLVCDNLRIYDVGRVGILAITGKNITYSNNYIYNVFPGGGGIAPFLNAYGMSVTSDTSIAVPRPTNVKMTGNTVIGIEAWEAYDLHGVDGAIIENNTAINCMIGIYVGASTGGNIVNCDNVIVKGNYLNNLVDGGSAYSRAGILVGPSFAVDEYGDNILVSDNIIIGHGTSQATYDAGYTPTDGEGAIFVVRTRNCVVDSNVITTPYQIGIHTRAQNLGTSITNNRVDSPVTSNGEAFCFKANDSDECIITVSGNTFQRLAGTSSAVFVENTPTATYGIRYSEDNNHIGNFSSIFSGSSFSLLHNSSTWLTKRLASGRVNLTGSGATIVNGINISSVNRQSQGVVRVFINDDAINSNYFVSVIPESGSFASATFNVPAVGQIDFIMWSGVGMLADISFTFEIRGCSNY